MRELSEGSGSARFSRDLTAKRSARPTGFKVNVFPVWSLHLCSWSLSLTSGPFFSDSGWVDVNSTIVSSIWDLTCRLFIICLTFAGYLSTFSMVFLTVAPQTEQNPLAVVRMGWGFHFFPLKTLVQVWLSLFFSLFQS